MSDALGAPVDSNGITVLHVDDDPEFADLVSIYLERESSRLNVVTETSAEAGLDRLGKGGIDCVVSDYDMPDMDGMELLEAVRAEHPDLPFVLFTGKGNEEIASRAISAGVTDYLQKRGGTDQYAVLANRVENAARRYYAERGVERGFQAIESAREGISFLDESGRFVYVNRAYAETYGYDPGELIGEHWEVLYPDEHVCRVYEEILPAVPEEGQWSGESIHVRKDGERVIVDHALAHTDEGAILCLIQDITERKATERALETERQRFELFVDAVEEYAIFSLDTEGRVTSWNRGAARIKGYDQEEIVGEHFSVFYPDRKVEAGYPDELLARAVEEGTVEDEGWRLRADGSRFWAEVSITAVFDDDDRHRGFLKVTQDVTDRHRAREELADERRFIDQAIDMLEDVFYVLAPDGTITRVTERAVEVTGYSREELRAMDPTELFPPGDRPRVRKEIEEALATGSAHLEADVLTGDGHTIPYEFRKRRLTDDEGVVVGVVGIGRDVSDRKRRERRLQRQLDQFEHFGSVLSHDLRTPLRTVEGRLALARETGDPDHFDAAERALSRLDQLVDELASVMREGELVSDLGTVDVGECARDAWEPLAGEDATLRTPEPVRIRADAGALTRLLENLLKNAVEHGGDDVTVTIGPLADGFYVADDGSGIPEDVGDELFELGYSTKDDAEGTGFGLASARQIAVAHGWEITATAADGGGARFEVTDVEVA